MIIYGFLFLLIQFFIFGGSIEIVMRCESVASPRRFLNRVFIVFIWEKEHSTEVVPTGIAKHTFVRILKFGHIVSNCCHPSVELLYTLGKFSTGNSIHCSMQTTNFPFTVMCNILVLDSI